MATPGQSLSFVGLVCTTIMDAFRERIVRDLRRPAEAGEC
jgi:hypothetical protein